MRTRLSPAAFAAFAALALLACSGACSKPTPAPAVAPAEVPAPPAAAAPVDAGTVLDLTAVTAVERSCKTNADCALITEDCCGCDSGGKQVGVRKNAMAALAERRTPVCSQVACAQALSDDPSCDARRARCLEGQCVPDVPGAKAPAGVGVEKIAD